MYHLITSDLHLRIHLLRSISLMIPRTIILFTISIFVISVYLSFFICLYYSQYKMKLQYLFMFFFVFLSIYGPVNRTYVPLKNKKLKWRERVHSRPLLPTTECYRLHSISRPLLREWVGYGAVVGAPPLLRRHLCHRALPSALRFDTSFTCLLSLTPL